MSYENKILQLKQMLGKKKEEKENKPTFKKPDKPVYISEWQDAGLALIENDFGVLFKRQVNYPFHYKHGLYELGTFSEAIENWELSQIQHPFSINSDEQVVFFDTETTGLKGVGTQIFLIGLLEIMNDQFVLNQYVLADPSNEVAFLFESNFWQQSKTIVSYNGKSFDWPQLENRWTLHQNILPKLRNQRQIDLLHSSKRLWKNNLERMKLSLVEEEKLGFKRDNDIPGFLAPIIYTDAIRSGNAQNLMKVLCHNEWDLLSLVTLYSHLTKLLLDKNLHETATTYTNIGKWYDDLKQKKQSEKVLLNVTEEFNERETGLAYYYLAFQQKRNEQYKDAEISFEKAIRTIGIRQKLKSLEQLAMLNEHQFRNYTKAIQYTKDGLKIIQNNSFLKKEQTIKEKERWEKRLKRIEKKFRE